MKNQETYTVVKVVAGSSKRKALWQAWGKNKVIGSGSRPELAIRDAKQQSRLQGKEK